MKKVITLLTTAALISCLSFDTIAQTKLDVRADFTVAAEQYKSMLQSHQDLSRFPQSLLPDGKIKDMPSEWWCSGFFGGSLWYIYQYTHDPFWKKAADQWSMAVEKEKTNTHTHDLGFMLYCPFGNGYRLTKDIRYKSILLEGAKALATRYDPAYGVIKSWDLWHEYDYPVIIDNMMNLEFLLWAAKTSGDRRFYDISISHADHTLKNHFRKDYSSYHVVCYAPGGKVLARKTHQGYSDSSAWSRGQGWALYGYTMMYRFTKNKKYLKQAENIAGFILHNPNLPADKIPYWDFNAPKIPNEERDASAGAVMASALLELSTYSKMNRDLYFKNARAMLTSLSGAKYLAEPHTNGNFILKHSVGSKAQNSEVDTPIVYADYYYLEALLRYDQLINHRKLEL